MWSSQCVVATFALPIALTLMLCGFACPTVSLAAESGMMHDLQGIYNDFVAGMIGSNGF